MTEKISLTDAIISELEAMVSRMQPGERLPTESMLAEQFSVGRSTVRESLKVLSHKKLIVRKNGGTFVAENPSDFLMDPLSLILNMDVCNLVELIEFRELLEVIVVRLAVRRASEEDISLLEKCNWLLQEPGLNKEQKRERDFNFHNQLAKCAGNAIIAELLKAVRQVIANSLEKEPLPEPVSNAGSILHEKIIQSLRERNEAEAVSYMEEYLLVVDYEA